MQFIFGKSAVFLEHLEASINFCSLRHELSQLQKPVSVMIVCIYDSGHFRVTIFFRRNLSRFFTENARPLHNSKNCPDNSSDMGIHSFNPASFVWNDGTLC